MALGMEVGLGPVHIVLDGDLKNKKKIMVPMNPEGVHEQPMCLKLAITLGIGPHF